MRSNKKAAEPDPRRSEKAFQQLYQAVTELRRRRHIDTK
jgi:hypothetical protein